MPEPSHAGKCSWHWCDLIIQVGNCGFGVQFKAIQQGLLSYDKLFLPSSYQAQKEDL